MTGTAFPAIKVRRFELSLNENKASTESLFTRFRQVTSLSGGTGDRWEGVFETASLSESDTEVFMGWLMAVGLYGTFNMRDPSYSGVTSGATTGSVKGAGQTGTSLIIDGLATGTLIIRAGEFFQVGDQYFIATANATTNGSGEMTVNFKPALRVSPADNATVVFNTPVLTARLTVLPAKAPDLNRRCVFTCSFEEYISG